MATYTPFQKAPVFRTPICFECRGPHHVRECPLRIYAERSRVSSIPALRSECFHCHRVGHSPDKCWLCAKCGQYGHLEGTCRTVVCEECGRSGHSAAQCWKCDVCGQHGHLAKRCYSLRCDECGRPGHASKDCYRLKVCERCHRPGHPTEKCYATLWCKWCKDSTHCTVDCGFRSAQPASSLRSDCSAPFGRPAPSDEGGSFRTSQPALSNEIITFRTPPFPDPVRLENPFSITDHKHDIVVGDPFRSESSIRPPSAHPEAEMLVLFVPSRTVTTHPPTQ